MDIEIKKLSSQDLNDFGKLIKVFEAVFEMKDFALPDKTYLQGILNKPNFFVLAAKSGDEIIGGLTVYILDQYYSKKPLAYIYDLAVLTKYQRQGIGKTLIKHLIDYCKENGFEEVFVQTDKVDDYAIDFYRQTKPTNEEQVIHFNYTLPNDISTPITK